MSLQDVLEPLCARGFLRLATRLSLTSKAVAAALPMGTGKQIYEAAVAGNDGQLTVYLEYWRGSRDDSPTVFNWSCNCKWGESPLAAAAKHDRLACVKLLLSFAPTVDVNKGHCTPLDWACQSGRDEMVSALLATPSIDINKASSVSKRTPLHLAAQQGHAGVMRLLVAGKGIRLDAKDLYGRSPLSLAEEGKHDEVVAVLLQAIERKRAIDTAGSLVYNSASDGDVAALRPLLEQWSGNEDVLNWDGGQFQTESPICIASSHGHIEAVRLLISIPGVDVNKADKDGMTAILEAIDNDHTEIVNALLTAPGIDVNMANWFGVTAIVSAARKGRTEVVRALLAAPGIDVNKGHTVDKMAIMTAIRFGRTDIVRALLAAPGIDLNKADNDGMTAISYSTTYGTIEIVRALLVAPDIDVNKADKDGWTAIMQAAYLGRTEVVSALLAAPGIDINMVDKYGETAIILAVDNGHTEIVRALLSAPGIDVNKANNNGKSAIVLAAQDGCIDIVRALLAAPGIDANKADKDGKSAIIYAARNGHTEVVRALLAAPGIDANKVNNDGWSCLMLSAFWGRVNIARLLLTVEGIDVNTRAKNLWMGMSALDVATKVNGVDEDDDAMWGEKQEIAAMLRAAGGR